MCNFLSKIMWLKVLNAFFKSLNMIIECFLVLSASVTLLSSSDIGCVVE
jgi:hypothetical protein